MENSDPNFIKILLRIQGQILVLKVSKDSLLPEEGKMLRYYETETNCLGISFRHQLPDFKKFLCNIQISVQSGYFLKIGFPNRMARDLFLLELLR